jgi:WhiB family redox-sensing transcriptional regulator
MALSLTVLQPAWMAHARCREADPALFYPRFADQSFYAKRVCDSCPVAAECLDFALDTAEYDDHGVWGGLTRIERRKLRRLADQKGTAS